MDIVVYDDAVFSSAINQYCDGLGDTDLKQTVREVYCDWIRVHFSRPLIGQESGGSIHLRSAIG